MQEIGTITHLDAVASLDDPPILAATIVSGLVLVTATIGWLLWWTHSPKRKPTQKMLLIALACGIYFIAGILQIWLGEVFYRRYWQLDSSITLGLWVPVVPVWLAGIVAGVVFSVRRVRIYGSR